MRGGGISSRSKAWLLGVCAASACSIALVVAGLGGCTKRPDQPALTRYQTLPTRQVPPFMKDTIYERTEMFRTEGLQVSGFGIVANLNGTGESTAPTAVRQYVIKESIKHGVGSKLLPDQQGKSPEQLLSDPRVAIVEVNGFLPPGIRKDQRFDVHVSAIRESATSSIAGGDLWRTDLKLLGTDRRDPGGSVNVWARSEGPLFVNPTYALVRNPEDPGAKRSLRFGTVMDGGYSETDRPIGLRLFEPQWSMSRQIERRIEQRFQKLADRLKPNNNLGLAEAQDEGVVNFYIPKVYEGDWEHFATVVTHLYLYDSPEFSTQKAMDLAAEALKPDAPLMDISYCWEGLGAPALAVIRDKELMTHASPDVAFAAARAAAFLGDHTAPMVLCQMARNPDHPFQLNAIGTLGGLPSSPILNEQLRLLLDSDKTLVRLEAYKVLARNQDTKIFTRKINDRFWLDIVPSKGSPVIYATRRGGPRIALFGPRTSIDLPATIALMDGRLTISSDPMNQAVTLFYRPPAPPRARKIPDPIKVLSAPDIAEVVARLAGEGADPDAQQKTLSFNYAEVVAILSKMAESKKLMAVAVTGTKVPASFLLQDLPQMRDSIYSAPAIPEGPRPQTDEPVGMAK